MSDELRNNELEQEVAAAPTSKPAAPDATSEPAATDSAAGDSATGSGIGRRDMVRALASIPVLGIFFAAFFSKKGRDDTKRRLILNELGVSEDAPAIIPHAISQPPSDRIGIGIIGFGGEGEALMRGAGFAHPDWVERMRLNAQENPRDKRYEEFMSQGDLSLDFNAVCDVFDVQYI